VRVLYEYKTQLLARQHNRNPDRAVSRPDREVEHGHRHEIQSPETEFPMSTASLTTEQINFFKTFGYLVLKQRFTAAELATIQHEFNFMMTEQYGPDSYDGSSRHWAMMMDEDTPFFASLLEDPRFLRVARQLYGDDVIGMGVDCNRYTGDTPWHRDTQSVHQRGVKFAFYLQPVEAESGALRVIPGMHRLPDDDAFAVSVNGMAPAAVPCTALPSEPGDVVAFDLRLWHAAIGGDCDRRMCTVVYYENPKTAEEIEVHRKMGEINVRYGIREFEPKRQYLYSKSWMANPCNSPDRQAWIDRLSEIDYYATPGVVEV
jgi:hypothetical protein